MSANEGHVTLREYLERVLEEQRRFSDLQVKSHDDMHKLLQQMVTLAKTATDLRLEGMNELREQISSERGVYLRRETWEAGNSEISKRLTVIEQQLAGLGGRDRGVSMSWGVVVAVAGFGTAIGAILSKL